MKRGFFTSIKTVFIFFTVIYLTFSSPITIALKPENFEKFSQNNILFYDPDESEDCSSVYDGNIRIVGSTAIEKTWSGFRSAGFTPEQTAGILANINNESNFNPFRHEISEHRRYWHNPSVAQIDGHFDFSANPDIYYGTGLIGFSLGWRIDLFNWVVSRDSSATTYWYDPDTYSKHGSPTSGDQFMQDAGEDVLNTHLALQIEYLMDPNQVEYRRIPPVKEATTPEEAAQYWAESVEKCSSCSPGGSQYAARATLARELYEQYKHESWMSGLTTASSTNTTSSSITANTQIADVTTTTQDSGNSNTELSSTESDGSNVTIIGDSITVRSKDDLLNLMPNADITAEVSKTFYSGGSPGNNPNGFSILKDKESSGDLRDTVVFALGTNSAGLSTNQVEEVIATAGDSRTIIFVTNYSKNRIDFTSNNNIFKEMESKYNNVKVAYWDTAVSADPEKYLADDVHPTIGEGTKLFAQTIYNTIGNSTVANPCSGSTATGNVKALQDKVLEFAWPEYQSGRTDKKPEYAEVISRSAYKGDGCHGGGVDCGAFVYNLMVESGWDPNYAAGSTSTQKSYLEQNWQEIGQSGPDIESQLQPGDVAIVYNGRSHHVFVFVGDIPGFNSKYASASQCNRAPMAGQGDFDAPGKYTWYRKK